MRRTPFLLRSGLLLSLLIALGSDLRGQDQFDKDAFLSRKKWYATFILALKGNGNATRTEAGAEYKTKWNIRREVSGTFELDQQGEYGPSKSVLARGERYQGRYISWGTVAGWSDVSYLVEDRVEHSSKSHGEGGAITTTEGFTKLAGYGSTRIGRFKELKCDLKDMDFDFRLDALRGWDGDGPKTLKLSGEYHEATPITKLKFDHVYGLEEFTIRGILPEVTELLPQLSSRKLALVKGEIRFTASLPIIPLPYFSHSGTNYGGPMNFNGYTTQGGAPLELSLDVILSPTPPSRAKLILTPPKDYATTWRPMCSNSEETPGNRFDLGWKLEEEGGDPAKPTKAGRVTFSLLETSREPGVCMNRPLQPKSPPEFDLTFATMKPPPNGYTVAMDGQKLVIDGAQVGAGKGTVSVDCFDSGANGILVAEAELEDGRTVKGVVEGSNAPNLMIPDFEQGVSKIARGWRALNARGKPDNADDENDPVGDGQVGDGLTVWEEYRGFWVGGQWEGCDPGVKDLFILNGVGPVALEGIRKFAEITRLGVHNQLAAEDVKVDRVINFNHGSQPHLVDQHCLHVIEGGFDTKTDDGAPLAGSICMYTNGADFPGPPKNTLFVSILPSMLQNNFQSKQFRQGETYEVAASERTICHELGHALGIRHHGDKDLGLRPWKFELKKETGQILFYADGKEVTVRNEQNFAVTTDDLFGAKSAGENMFVWIGERNGQHAGDEACVMRYTVAQAYRSQRDANVLYYHGSDEIRGTRLCISPAGTGLNMPTHEPQSRYFGAETKRGNCAHKFVVSDRWEKLN
ncbi:MAG TPA: hypothetical protein VE981_19900 [Planctomycetota bacterium]|nr:hypothetical protein [Planctomycetota bacterium]